MSLFLLSVLAAPAHASCPTGLRTSMWKWLVMMQ